MIAEKSIWSVRVEILEISKNNLVHGKIVKGKKILIKNFDSPSEGEKRVNIN